MIVSSNSSFSSELRLLLSEFVAKVDKLKQRKEGGASVLSESVLREESEAAERRLRALRASCASPALQSSSILFSECYLVLSQLQDASRLLCDCSLSLSSSAAKTGRRALPSSLMRRSLDLRGRMDRLAVESTRLSLRMSEEEEEEEGIGSAEDMFRVLVERDSAVVASWERVAALREELFSLLGCEDREKEVLLGRTESERISGESLEQRTVNSREYNLTQPLNALIDRDGTGRLSSSPVLLKDTQDLLSHWHATGSERARTRQHWRRVGYRIRMATRPVYSFRAFSELFDETEGEGDIQGIARLI